MFGIRHHRISQEKAIDLKKQSNRIHEYIAFLGTTTSQSNNHLQYKIFTKNSVKKLFHPTYAVSAYHLASNPIYWSDKEQLLHIFKTLYKQSHRWYSNKYHLNSFIIVPVNLINRIPVKVLNRLVWFEKGLEGTIAFQKRIRLSNLRYILNKQLERNVTFLKGYSKDPLNSKVINKIRKGRYVAIITSNKPKWYFVLTPKYHYYKQKLPVVPPKQFVHFSITYKQLIKIRKDMLKEKWTVSPIILPINKHNKVNIPWKQISKTVNTETSALHESLLKDSGKFNPMIKRLPLTLLSQIKRDTFLSQGNYLV